MKNVKCFLQNLIQTPAVFPGLTVLKLRQCRPALINLNKDFWETNVLPYLTESFLNGVWQQSKKKKYYSVTAF